MTRSLAMLALCLVPVSATAQSDAKNTQVMIFGVFHMNNPSRDLVNPTIKDVLGERRQKEIQDIVARLERFKPTKIALESPAGSKTLQERLYKFLAGSYTLTPDERDQIGLRLAKSQGHAKVYPIDFKQDLNFDAVFRYAKENGQGPLLQKVFGEFETKIKPKLESGYMEKHTVREILLEGNAQATLDLSHRFYMGLMLIGKDDRYAGSELV